MLKKSVLYFGVTNDIANRMYQHFEYRGNRKSFAGRFYCYNLVYYELFHNIDHAIEREKQLKNGAGRKKRINS